MLNREAFGALVRAKRGAKGITQETLALDVFGDSTRKGDISRIENARTAPQEATVQKLINALGISEAEMAPVRQGQSAAAQFENLDALTLDQLEDLAARFGIDDPYGKPAEELRGYLTDKARDYRILRQQIAQLDDKIAEIAAVKAQADAAAEAGQLEEVERLLTVAVVHEQTAATQTNLTRAQNALLRNRPEQAFQILSAAADAFGGVEPTAPSQLRGQFYTMLYDHGLRYGGPGLALAEQMLRTATDNLPPDAPLALRLVCAGNLANTQSHAAQRIPGEAGAAKQGEAVATYRELLNELSDTEHPEDWATAQQNLGVALESQGTRTPGEAGAILLAEAVENYRAALRVKTEAEHPLQWATTMQNLGGALATQGARTPGKDGTTLLAEAVDSYRAALRVTTEADHPLDWAMTTQNLGVTLQTQGTRTPGEDGTTLLAKAVENFRAALRVTTEADHPLDWARTMQNLGIALKNQGTRTPGKDGTTPLANAVESYRAALRVRTEADHPLDWATTQENFAILFWEWARHDSSADPAQHLQTALTHVDAALTVYDEHTPYDLETATNLRAKIRAALDAPPSPPPPEGG